MDTGVLFENEDGTQLGHWPMGIDEAHARAAEEWPDSVIVRHEVAD